MLGIIVQARLGSTRLPNKMILPFYEEKGVLEIILNKIIIELPNIPLVVATTTNPKDDEIVNICRVKDIYFHRGSEKNVLKRFIETAKEYNFSKVIRVCADNPFIDIKLLKCLIDDFKNKNIDYLSFKTKAGTPTILTHYGFWTEGVSLNALERVIRLTKDRVYLEHVTNYIHSNPDIFNIELKSIDPKIEKVLDLRLTIDTEEDFHLLKEIYYESLRQNISEATDIANLVEENKKWLFQMKEQIKLNTK